ncbi:winged helix-turn-helix domain-containing protein [Thiopseudomonas alkaliphila]|uniref:winged helix-turn-helix domain-containing protein n=1 Tax=Thiopseudomonas alkaliphila TaxID=1697053 RepID=UPI0038B5120E
MLPLLKFSADGEEHTMQEARDWLAKLMGLSKEDLRERLPSGRQTTFANRVAWTKVHLTQTGVLESPKRGSFWVILQKTAIPQKDLRSKSIRSKKLECQNGHAQGTVWAQKLFRQFLSQESQA